MEPKFHKDSKPTTVVIVVIGFCISCVALASCVLSYVLSRVGG